MEFESHQHIIDVVWGSVSEYARSIGALYETARRHRRHGNIPSTYWEKAIENAKQRGHGEVTLDLLMKLQRPRKKAKHQESGEISHHG